ncbi:MAG TPA: hypothetical protein DCX06_04545 [Opitutae bacterium]|nr:hypothetical protein [Opitutae bacterium]
MPPDSTSSPNSKRLNRLHIALIAITLTVVALIYSSHEHWFYVIGPLHNLQLGYPFADMMARLGVAEGISHGIDVNNEVNPFGNPHALNNKPLYTVTILSFLGLDKSHTIPMGVFFCATYLLWNFWLLRPRSFIELVVILSILLSPPALTLLERANDDIIIYTFICFVPLLMASKATWGKPLGWLIISLLTPMKYYPAVVYSLFVHKFKNIKELTCYTLISVFFVGGLLWTIQDELRNVSERFPDPPGNCSFGKTLLFQTLKIDAAQHSILFIYGIAIVAIIAATCLLHPKIQKDEIEGDSKDELYFLLGSSVLTFCFFLSGNWDYRLIFVIPTLPLLLRLLKSSRRIPKATALTYLIATLLTAWPEYIYFWSIFDTVELGWLINYKTYQKISIIEHTASWIMITTNIMIATMILKNDLLSWSPISRTTKA